MCHIKPNQNTAGSAVPTETALLVVGSCPDIWSTRLYGPFSLDKTLTLQAGSTVKDWILAALRPELGKIVIFDLDLARSLMVI